MYSYPRGSFAILANIRSQHHRTSTFKFPTDCPYVSIDCQNLILQLLAEKAERISSIKYREQDYNAEYGIGEHPRKYVFAEDDAVDIKSHR